MPHEEHRLCNDGECTQGIEPVNTGSHRSCRGQEVQVSREQRKQKSAGLRAKYLPALLFAYATLIFLGGLGFYAIEHYNEKSETPEMKIIEQYMDASLKELAIQLLSISFENRTCATVEEIKKLVTTIMSEHQPRSDQSGWTFANSFLFAITVVTTIGYGHLTISTTAGKVFTVLYSIVGIPIFVITSQQVGLHLCTLSKKLYKRIEKRPCLKRRRRLMALLTNLSLGFTIFMLAPASIFCAVEGWAYADSLYFVFISLTTIGFGDFYPTFSKDHDTAAYRIFVSVWIVLGLVWMATAAAATIDTVKKWAKRWRRRSRRGSTRQQRNLDSDDTSSSEDEF